MAGILPCGSVTRQAQIAEKRVVAKEFASDVQRPRGADTVSSFSDAKTKLVEAELEMVRPGWVLQHSRVIRRFCGRSRPDRIQRSEIDGCLQRCADPGQGAPCCHRGAWFAYYRGISSLGKHERQRRVR